MRVEFSKEVTVGCPYREDGYDTYSVTVQYTAPGPYIDIPAFEDVLSQNTHKAISGEQLAVQVAQGLRSSTINKLKVLVDNTDDEEAEHTIFAEAGDIDDEF